MAAMVVLRHLAACVMLLFCAAVGAQPVERRLSDTPTSRDNLLFRQTMIAAHNAARSTAGVSPLAWDDRLAASARDYAQAMARSGRFAHADQPDDFDARQGENLWMGTRDGFAFPDMVGHWVDERRVFVNAATPDFSRTGRWEDVGHYTQIVWRSTRAFGCAIASNGEDDYVVCRYYPPGNVIGQRPY